MKKPHPQCETQARNVRTGRYRRCPFPARYLVSTLYAGIDDRLVCGIHARAWSEKALISLELVQ